MAGSGKSRKCKRWQAVKDGGRMVKCSGRRWQDSGQDSGQDSERRWKTAPPDFHDDPILPLLHRPDLPDCAAQPKR